MWLLQGMAEDDGGWETAAAPPLLLPLFVVAGVGVAVAALLAEAGCCVQECNFSFCQQR